MNTKSLETVWLVFLAHVEYNRNMREELELPIYVPEDADESFDPGYVPVEDPHHGDEELGDVPDEEVTDEEDEVVENG